MMADYLISLEMTRDNLTQDLQLINTVPELKSDHVSKCAGTIRHRSGALHDQLKKIHDKGDGFWHQFFRGERERQDLVAKKDQLADAERQLQDALRAVHVGLTKSVQNDVAQLVVNHRDVLDINAKVTALLGKDKGLIVASIIKDKTPDGKLPVELISV